MKQFLRKHFIKHRGCPPSTPGWKMRWTLRNGWNWHFIGHTPYRRGYERLVAEFKIENGEAVSTVHREVYYR